MEATKKRLLIAAIVLVLSLVFPIFNDWLAREGRDIVADTNRYLNIRAVLSIVEFLAMAGSFIAICWYAVKLLWLKRKAARDGTA